MQHLCEKDKEFKKNSIQKKTHSYSQLKASIYVDAVSQRTKTPFMRQWAIWTKEMNPELKDLQWRASEIRVTHEAEPAP